MPAKLLRVTLFRLSSIRRSSQLRRISATSDGFVSLVDIDLSAYFNQKKAVKKTLTIPEWLNEAAIEKGINFSQALQDALLAKITN